MRRITITLSAALMLLAVGPASALARHHHRTRRHHTRHARIERFGDVTSPSTSSNSADNAGTVQSFAGGILTIALNDGSTVRGAVTDNTELECMAPEQSQTMHEDSDPGSGDQSGDSSGSGDNQAQSSEDQSAGEDQGDAAEQNQAEDQNENQAEDQNENEAAEENENEAANSCTTANLAPGTVVHDAELRISSAGSVWKKVELES